jgi:hypothetical protein
MTTESRLQVTITAREDWNEETYTQVWNIKERLLDFILGFGNGIWVEIRIVAKTEEGLKAIRDLLRKGGYHPEAQLLPETTLFQPGDECWAGFVFLADVQTKSDRSL